MNVKQDKSGKGLPITRIETISDSTVDHNRVGFAGLMEENCRDWLLEPGDILFSHINSVEHIGKCAVYRGTPEKLVHGMNLLCLRADSDKLLPEFAKYLIRGNEFRSRLSNFVNKAVNQASVSVGNLKTIPVIVPSVARQQRIAQVLDRAEALRSKRRDALAQLDTLTQSIFLDLFGDPVTNPKRVKVVRLADVATRITDGVHLKPNYTESGVAFISVKDITTGKLLFDDCKYVSVEDHERFTKRCKPERLDILYTKVGATYGRPAIVETDREFSIYVSVCIIKPRKEIIDPYFLNAAMGTAAVKNQADRRIKGIGVPDLHLDQIQNFLIPLPSMSEQREFTRRVTAVESLKTAHRASLAELDELFASLQHRAFSGEL
jgi:type I restriction enzyme S subunit